MKNLKGKLIPKLKAVAVHLGLSLLVFAGILYLVLYIWYPEPFFTAQGGWQGLLLIAFVGLVLGPFLTFIVINPKKQRKAVIFDLAFIALLQVTTMIWGVYQVYTQRPVALVFWNNAFYTVTGEDYMAQGLKNLDFSRFSNHAPPLIYSRPLTTMIEMEQFRLLTEKSIPVYAHVSLYEKVEDNLGDIFLHGIDIDEVMSKNASMKLRLEKIVGDNAADYNYIPLRAKYQNMILIMEESGKLVGELKAPYLHE